MLNWALSFHDQQCTLSFVSFSYYSNYYYYYYYYY